jgi:hypothetical protein
MAKKTALQTTAIALIPQDMTPRKLQALAENKSIEILQKINATTKRIAKAKKVAKNAAKMKTGWFGKTEEKVTATAKSGVATNEAMSEMNNLLQESIRFTCSSIQFAQVMHKTMAHMMVKGFKDTDGQIIKLSGDSKEVVQSILDEADDFVKKQLAVEKKQADLEAKIDENAGRISENKGKIAENKVFIAQNKAVIAGLTERLSKSEANQNALEQKLANIEILAKKGAFAILVSIVGFVCAVIALVLNFV